MTNNSLNQIERACADLARNGEPVTAVATHTGIARSTLYRNQTLRVMIEHHRDSSSDQTITALTDELATLRVTIGSLADTVRRHDAQIRRLTRD